MKLYISLFGICFLKPKITIPKYTFQNCCYGKFWDSLFSKLYNT